MTAGDSRYVSADEAGLLAGFLREADDMLAEAEAACRRLEEEPSNLDLIHEIFRVVHSLKGNSSFFNFVNVKRFLHTLESFLSLIRERSLDVNEGVVRQILDGADHIKSIFNRLADNRGADVTLLTAEEAYLEEIGRTIGQGQGDEWTAQLRGDLAAFFEKTRREEGMDEDSPVKEIYDIIARSAPALIGKAKEAKAAPSSRWLSGKLDVTREYGEVKNLLAEAKAGRQTQGGLFFAALERLIARHWNAAQGDRARELEAVKGEFETFYQDEIGLDEVLTLGLIAIIAGYEKRLTEIKPEAALDAPGAAARAKLERRQSFTRIDESLLDVFLDNVGELITMGELLNFLQRKLEERDYKGLAESFKHTNQSFRELSQKLQESLYEIRKAPVEGSLAKLPRIVRGVCRETGKLARISTSGGETEVDKSMLEKLETMLVHMVINSADHGLEKPEERLAVGKGKEGKIDIKISSGGLNLLMEVSDDGRGVSLDKVRKTAVARGLISPADAERLSDKEALGLILRPGFSTREKVTDRSGRGVGLDVVASRVREMGGSLSLANMPGEGFKISLTTPLAYVSRIKMGLSMLVGRNIFLTPAEHVRESFRAAPGEVTFVEDRSEVVRRWGRIYPVVRLHKLFNLPAARMEVSEAILVLVETGGHAVCLMVDEMLGQRQIVYKQLTVKTMEPSAFEGVSILDGTRMALILNVDGIIKQFQKT
jgi:two-component system chemotaxis sensor kinase CheA